MALNPKQTQVAAAIACGDTRAEAARKFNISAQTISRWQRELPEFNEEIDRQLMESLGQLRPKAVAALSELIDSDQAWLKLHAAREILTRCGLSYEKINDGVVRIEVVGMPELGSPDAEADDDE